MHACDLYVGRLTKLFVHHDGHVHMNEQVV